MWRPSSLASPATQARQGFAAVLGRRRFSEGGGRGDRVLQRQQCPRRECGGPDRGRSRVTIQALEETRHASSARSIGGPRLPQGGAAMYSAIAPWSGQQCLGKDCRQYPGLKRTRASANTSGPDSTMARRPLVKLRGSLRRAAPNEENSFLLPDRKENGPTVDLMSRRHPLSSIRSSRRR